MVLSVFMRTHCGMGLFFLSATASLVLVLKVLWDGCREGEETWSENGGNGRGEVQFGEVFATSLAALADFDDACWGGDRAAFKNPPFCRL